jgi:RNA polymerase sigma-70 factor, ECF subfamily
MPLFDSLYNFASWLVHNKTNAEDLVQETYLKALRSFASFQPGTNFRAWMFRILRNTFLSSRSTLDRRMTVEIDSEEDVPALPATSATPESLLIERSRKNAVQNAIEQLPVIFQGSHFTVRCRGCVLPGDLGNIVDPDGNCYVAPGQSAEGGSRVSA